MTQQPEPIGDRLAHLTEVGRELVSEIKELTGESGDHYVSLTKLGRDNRRMIRALAFSFALTLALVAAFGFALKRVDDNNSRIDSLTHRLDVAQSDTRSKAWCPLYQLLLESESPKARAAAEDPKAYDHAFKVIRDGYDALNCDEFRNAPPAFTPSPKG